MTVESASWAGLEGKTKKRKPEGQVAVFGTSQVVSISFEQQMHEEFYRTLHIGFVPRPIQVVDVRVTRDFSFSMLAGEGFREIS